MKKNNFILLIAFLLAFTLNAQAEFFQFSRFDKITQDNGLSSNHVLSICQEEAGWMWFGTSHGINRYDGYQFRVFKSDVEGAGTLRGDLVRCIFEDKQNRIWVGTERGGLNLFNREREAFEHFYFEDSKIDTVFSVNSIALDENNRLLLATDKGLAFLNDKNKLELIPLQTLKAAGNPEVTKLYYDRRNNLWMGTYGGLFIIDFFNNTEERIVLPNTDKPYDEIQSLYFDSDNVLWIGTYNSGVYTGNIHTGVVKKLDGWVTFDRAETVRSICEDKQGTMWFGTRGGLISYNKILQEFSSYLRDDDEALSLSLNSVLSLCVDSKGDLWIGTRGGIHYRDQNKQAFVHLKAAKSENRFLNNAEVFCFCFNGDDLLIGTESGGVNIFNRKTQRFSYVTMRDGLSSDCIKSFVVVGDEILVATYQGGISILDKNTYAVKRTFRHDKNNPSSLRDDVVWDLEVGKDGKIWVATNRGVDQYDPITRTFLHQNAFPEKVCYWLKEDETGDMWFGGDDLYIYNPKTKKTSYFQERTRDVIAAPDGKYWVAMRGHGLALFDKIDGVIMYLAEADGLCNNNVQTILRDQNGCIWLSTSNGLTRMEEETHSFVNFDINDGLQDNHFNYGAAIYDETKNLLFFGGINGLNIFNPSEIRKNYFIPPIVFTNFKIFNEPAIIGVNLEKSINLIDKVDLKHTQNMFSIEFAALSFSNAQKNQYQYMLEGFDNNWISVGNHHSATYTNLNPGKYLFKVRGSNSNGIWSDKNAELEVVVHPPFWNTWWFRILGITLLVLLLIYLSQIYLHRAKLNNELVFEKTKAKKLHEIENMKLRFFTNISHEIRTPLTLILGPINQILENNSLDTEVREKLNLVRRNADQLLKLINQLLDFRKMEAGKQVVNYEKSDIVFFLHSIKESFQGMAEERGINLTFSSDKEKLATWFDNDKIQKIVNNLLSNALKFTAYGGSVSMIFETYEMIPLESVEKQSFYKIIVKDTGKGISQGNLSKIFNRFEQGVKEQDARGSGIGLSITRDFVKLMDGEIEVTSVEGQGACFTVILPIIDDMDVEKEEEQEELTDEMVGDKNQKIILIAEDNADVREYTTSNFRSDYKVIEAQNGKEAYELAVQYVPDIIVSDLLMPVMSGDTLCKKIKKDERTSHIPFVLLTAVTSKGSEKEALKAGADDYITKPFDVNILKLKVDNLLSLRDTLRDKYKNDYLLQPTSVILVSPDEKFLKKAVDIIEQNIDDPDYDIETFASEIGVSRMQLYRKLEALTNMTVKEFIRDIRIKRAAQLLEQNKANVSEIIYQVGFRDLAYFRKCFREQYGTSPSEYASRFKKKSEEQSED